MPSAKRETILVKGGRVYDHDGNIDSPDECDVLIENGAIKSVTKVSERSGEPAKADRVIEASGKLLLPGFFNTHYHSHDTLLKGSFENITLDHWGLMAIPATWPRRSKQELRLRTLVGAIECLRTGMSTIMDMDMLFPFDEEDLDTVLEAYDDVGIRCIFGPQFANVGRVKSRAYYDEMLPESERWRLLPPAPQFAPGTNMMAVLGDAMKARRGKYDLIELALAPISPESCTPELLEQVADLSKRENFLVYSHIYENKGMTVVARVRFQDYKSSIVHYLDHFGLLNEKLTLAHSIWLREDEIEMLAAKKANVALNPVGNLKTRSGVAPFRELMDAGVNFGLGCDNCSCSDAQNMFQAMKLFTLLAGMYAPDSEGPPHARDAIYAATQGGARTSGRSDLGAIRPGMRADITILDLSDISFVPLNSVARQVVYTESGRAVRSVIVDGRMVIEDGKLLTVDEEAIRREVADIMPALLRDLESIKDRLKPILPTLAAIEKRTFAYDLGVKRTLTF